MTKCPACASANPEGSRYCNQCGTELAAGRLANEPASRGYTPQHLIDKVLRNRSALEGERKQVTVFFADMAGSTRLAESVDPEDWHRILDQFFSILGEEIHRYEGTINQYTGDGVMALFGAPIAHEDHALRAAHAALALQSRLREFADSLRLEQGINLSARMGMNSGEVVVGRIGDDLRMDYTAKGLTVNLAARMEQIAEPGRIYLTQHTANLVEGYFTLRDLGATRIKGASESIGVMELVAATDASLRLEVARQRGLSRFIGRRRELKQMNELLALARMGEGQILLVKGDGGLGKSRLCFEALELWRELDIRILHASAVPYSRSVPLLPIRTLMRQRFGVSATDSDEDARSRIAGALLLADPGFREHLPLLFEFLDIADSAAPASAVPPDARGARMMDLYRRFCPTEDSRPTVVLLEDLHWIDPASIEFLKVLSEASTCAPLLLIFNTRPEDTPSWLADKPVTEIHLQPLDVGAMAEMTAELLGEHPSLAELAPRITAMAAGNPFFIEETIRALAADGVLDGRPGAWRAAADVGAVDIPPSVHAVIAGRIDRLDAASKELLQTAAVLGRSFSLELLEAVSGMSEKTLQAALEALNAGHYLQTERAQQPVELGFCHPLFQEVAYGSLLSDRRQALHAACAVQIERQIGGLDDPGEAVLRLADHWDRAGVAMAAARWSLAAGVWVVSRDPSEEVRLLRRAIELLTPLPEDPEAVPIAVSARAALVRASVFFRIPGEEVDAAFTQAREIAQAHNHRIGLAELLISYGGRLQARAQADRAADQTSEALQLVHEIGDPTLIARFRIPILFSNFAAGRLRSVRTLLDERDGGAWHTGEMREDDFLSRGFRAILLACMGEFDVAIREADASIAFAESHERAVSWMYANLVDIEALSGRSARALSLGSKAVNMAEDYGSPLFSEVAFRSLAQALLITGDAAGAREILEETLNLVEPDAVAFQFRSAHYALLARCLAAQKDYPAATVQAQLAIQAAADGQLRVWEARALLSLSRVLIATGQKVDRELQRAEELIKVCEARAFLPQLLRLQADAKPDCDEAETLRGRADAIAADLGILPSPSAAQALDGQPA